MIAALAVTAWIETHDHVVTPLEAHPPGTPGQAGLPAAGLPVAGLPVAGLRVTGLRVQLS